MLSHEEVQASISARLDGEDYDLADDVIDAHIASCGQCREYQDKAVVFSKALAVPGGHLPMLPPENLSDMIMAGVESQWREARASRHLNLAMSRLFMVVMGIIFVLWAVDTVVSTSGMVAWAEDGRILCPGADPQKAAFLVEDAAMRLGLASGLFFAAWRPSNAPGMLPIITTMFMFLAGFAVRDIVVGRLELHQVYMLLSLAFTSLALGWAWAADKGYAGRGWFLRRNA